MRADRHRTASHVVEPTREHQADILAIRKTLELLKRIDRPASPGCGAALRIVVVQVALAGLTYKRRHERSRDDARLNISSSHTDYRDRAGRCRNRPVDRTRRRRTVSVVVATSTHRTGRRAFSLGEMTLVVLVLGIISAIAFTTLGSFRSGGAEKTANSTLLSVASAQQLHHISRGQWATTTGSLDGLGTGVTLTSGPSYSAGSVSVTLLDTPDGDALGLAVLVDNDTCLTLLLEADQGVGTSQSHALTGLQTCTGELAE